MKNYLKDKSIISKAQTLCGLGKQTKKNATRALGVKYNKEVNINLSKTLF